MCGIAGAWLSSGSPFVAAARMSGVLAHRGPDDDGAWGDELAGVGLAHRRLSILDPTPAGHQPMCSPSGRLHIVYNGEIYNFRELRSVLQREGAAFRTESDTEVLLAAWERWGSACLTRLRGMYAFGLWDSHEQELVLVRDRVGIKPLYYSEVEGGIIFASEVRALLASGLLDRTVDHQAVWDVLSHGSVAEPRTILRDARAVPPGHLLRVRQGAVTVERYWDVATVTADSRAAGPPEYADAVRDLREILERAMSYHLISDVPLGAFLSGGIDSTAVVGLATAAAGRPIRTFSVGYGREHGALNELHWARLAARRFGSEHTEVMITDGAAVGLLDTAGAALDQPSVDGTNTFLVSQAARREVVVALSGLGGDELFAGYSHFARFARGARLAPAGGGLLRRIAGERALGVLPGRVRQAINAIVDTPAERLAAFRMLSSETARRAAVTAEFLDPFEPTAPAARTALLLRDDLDPFAQVSYAELNGYLRDTLLRDTDAMSMAHGLEIRPVLLDHEIVEFAFSLPAEFKNGGGQTKRILVDAVSDLLPPEIRARPKAGFELPLGAWLRGPLRGRALALLDSPTARQLLSPGFRRQLRAQLDGGRGGVHRLWAVLILLVYLETWCLDLDS